MDSIRKWFYKPRRDDTSLLAQFFYADEALNMVAAELDSFDGRKDQERCTSLVNHLRQCQDKVLTICNHIMDELIPNERADRDFRVKFPDDVMQDNLSGQLWFGAECLAAGSNIMNREAESGAMRPLAKALTKSLENVRNLLREASMRSHPPSELTHDRLIESLKMFDRLLADFELCYVSAMVPVKSVHEYQLQQDVIVLFSETLDRALKLNLLTQEMVDQCDPALMFTIPRLAIVTGLLIHPEGPLNIDTTSHNMSEMFRPFKTLLVKIRELLWSLTESELLTLEKMLCSSEDSSVLAHKHSMISDGNGGENSEEESSCWGGEGETSECETVVEKLPSSETDPELNNLSCMEDSGVNSSESPVANDSSPSSNINLEINSLEEETREDLRTIEELGTLREDLGTLTEGREWNYLGVDEDEISEGANSSYSLSGGPALTGQWTLPIIPCACSVELSEDATMTKQGLMNRSVSLQQDAEFLLGNVETICEVCLKQTSDIDVPSDVKSQSGVEEVEDVRWPEPGPSECDMDTVLESVRQSDSDSVQSNGDIINSDDNVNYKQNVSLSEGLRTVDRKRESEDWKKKQVGEVSGDLHVRYAENWEALCSSGQLPDSDKRHGEDRAESLTSSCSSYHSTFSVTSDSRSLTSETSSFNSECQDNEEVALALRAVQQATKNEARAKFRSSGDLLQRLFVCISGVADQLQTNFAGDLRHILKSVFLINSSDCLSQEEEINHDILPPPHNSEDVPPELCENGEEALVWGTRRDERGGEEEEEDEVLPPLWLPDEAAPFCLSCMAMFTVIRRRHHCRNCGLVYCARCSSNSVPLPRYGHVKPVRVCDRCFNYHFSSHTSSIETH